MDSNQTKPEIDKKLMMAETAVLQVGSHLNKKI